MAFILGMFHSKGVTQCKKTLTQFFFDIFSHDSQQIFIIIVRKKKKKKGETF
jgi:hypothetical protein